MLLSDLEVQARTQDFEKGGYEGKTQVKPHPLLMTTPPLMTTLIVM